MNDRKKIYIVDINNETYYNLTRFNYQIENELLILEEDNNNKLFIVNSYYEIQIFKSSVYITIMQDMRYFRLFIYYF